MIHVDTADKLLNFGARIGQGPRAREQLEGAVRSPSHAEHPERCLPRRRGWHG